MRISWLLAALFVAGCSSAKTEFSCRSCSTDAECPGGQTCRGVCVGPGDDPLRCPQLQGSSSGATASTGSTGTSGSTGSTGSIGSTGTIGSSGTSGSTGSTGMVGSSGSSGSTGSVGSSGTSGSSGSTGGGTELTIGPFSEASFSLAQPRFGHQVLTQGTEVAVLGGRTRFPDGGSTITDVVEALDLGSAATFRIFGGGPQVALASALQQPDGTLIIVGGTEPGLIHSPAVRRVSWCGGTSVCSQQIGQLGVPRRQAALAEAAGELWVIGGNVAPSGNAPYPNTPTIEGITVGPTTATVEAVASYPDEVRNSTAAVWQDGLFVIGGEHADGGGVSDIRRAPIYPDAGLGTFAAAGTLPSAIDWAAGLSLCGHELLVGGSANGFSSVALAEVQSAPWLADGGLGDFQVVTTLVVPRWATQVVFLDGGAGAGELWVIGGNGSSGPTASLEHASVTCR